MTMRSTAGSVYMSSVVEYIVISGCAVAAELSGVGRRWSMECRAKEGWLAMRGM